MTDVHDLTLHDLWESVEADPSPDVLAHVLVTIRDLRGRLAELAADVEQSLARKMPDKILDVPDVGRFERKVSRRRSQWDHDALVAAVIARIVDDPDVWVNAETGELHPLAERATRIAARLRDCISFGAGKVTGLRALGLQPDEYCQEDGAKVSILLPPKVA